MAQKDSFIRGKFTLPLGVLAIGAVLSIALGVAAHFEITRNAQQRFDAVAMAMARKVEGRFDDYVEVLAGLRARFNTLAPLTRSEFRDYVDRLDLPKNYPGFQAVNYASYVEATDKQRFEHQMRSDGSLDAATASNFAIKPRGERAGYYPLTFIEPSNGNEALLGNDLGTMPNGRSALEQSRDTDGLFSSGRKIPIAGREADIGLAIRLPVFRPRMLLDTIEQRREAYRGSVGAGFSVAAMMHDVLGGDDLAALRLRLIDGGPRLETIGTRVESRFVEPTAVAQDQLLYDNASAQAPAAPAAGNAVRDPAPTAATPRFERTLDFKLGGHRWLVEVSQDRSQVIGRLDAAIPWLIVFCGMVISTLLAGIFISLTTSRGRAQAQATDMTRHLRASERQCERAEQDLGHVASHDALTGLSNRGALQRELERAIQRSHRQRKRLAVMLVDLDRFKHINDSLGHGVGDTILKASGERLTDLIRGIGTVARFGGDEFVLLLENVSTASDAAALAERALACCAEPFVIDGRELEVTASIGVSVYPEDGSDTDTLLKNAGSAMVRAKDQAYGSYGFYTAQMNAHATERLVLESGLRHALQRGELDLHYQPRMNLQAQVIVGVEALMRWRHPTLGMVSPAQFIPIAEEIGLIESLGKWALHKACTDARAWQNCGLPPVQMSVNLSPRQLGSRTLIADIGTVLASTGLEPELLELEITEGAMMKNPEHAAALLQEIRDMGIGLAIDDFGTGYSSLSYLRRFPLSTVKIDRSFINDLQLDAGAQALTDGIITLAHGLRMKVVAEGVETAAQMAYLRTRGCDEIQGYWLCKPLPANEISQFMASHMRKLYPSPVAA